MAQKVNVSFVDDLDGSEADATVTFALDGRTFEIDLSTANASRLRDVMATYVAAGRRAGRATTRAARVAGDREENQAIREWAETHGVRVAPRGRISAEVVAAYRARGAATPTAATPTAATPAPAEPVAAPAKRPAVAQPVFSGG